MRMIQRALAWGAAAAVAARAASATTGESSEIEITTGEATDFSSSSSSSSSNIASNRAEHFVRAKHYGCPTGPFETVQAAMKAESAAGCRYVFLTDEDADVHTHMAVAQLLVISLPEPNPRTNEVAPESSQWQFIGGSETMPLSAYPRSIVRDEEDKAEDGDDYVAPEYRHFIFRAEMIGNLELRFFKSVNGDVTVERTIRFIISVDPNERSPHPVDDGAVFANYQAQVNAVPIPAPGDGIVMDQTTVDRLARLKIDQKLTVNLLESVDSIIPKRLRFLTRWRYSTGFGRKHKKALKYEGNDLLVPVNGYRIRAFSFSGQNKGKQSLYFYRLVDPRFTRFFADVGVANPKVNPKKPVIKKKKDQKIGKKDDVAAAGSFASVMDLVKGEDDEVSEDAVSDDDEYSSTEAPSDEEAVSDEDAVSDEGGNESDASDDDAADGVDPETQVMANAAKAKKTTTTTSTTTTTTTSTTTSTTTTRPKSQKDPLELGLTNKGDLVQVEIGQKVFITAEQRDSNAFVGLFTNWHYTPFRKSNKPLKYIGSEDRKIDGAGNRENSVFEFEGNKLGEQYISIWRMIPFSRAGFYFEVVDSSSSSTTTTTTTTTTKPSKSKTGKAKL